MSPIPGEPNRSKSTAPQELTLKDGTKVRVKMPGMPARVEPLATEERGAAEPPRDDPRPTHNPYHAGPGI